MAKITLKKIKDEIVIENSRDITETLFRAGWRNWYMNTTHKEENSQREAREIPRQGDCELRGLEPIRLELCALFQSPWMFVEPYWLGFLFYTIFQDVIFVLGTYNILLLDSTIVEIDV